MGPKVLAQGVFEGRQWLGGPCLFRTLNDRWCPNGPGQQPGGRVSLALGLGGPQTPALQQQASWEGPLRALTYGKA